MSEGGSPDKIGQRDVHAVLLHFYALFRLAKFYASNNAVVQSQMTEFLSLIEPFLAKAEEVEIGVQQRSIYVNRTLIKFDFSNYHISKSLLARFNALELGEITFRAGITLDELSRFITFLSQRNAQPEKNFEKLSADFTALDCPHVLVERATYAANPPGKSAARMYFLGITHLQEVFAEKQPVLNYNLTKRWVQSMTIHLSLDESFLIGLTNIKNINEYTLNHSVNVCVLALALGRRLGLSRHELTELGVGALFHDLGKLDIPNDILDKPGALDSRERTIIETHSQRGAERLVSLAIRHGIPSAAIQIALEHHEKHDMSGYPLFARKKSVGLYGKIVKVIDYFDALTTKRGYRIKAFTPEEALKMMAEKSGVEFDPVILKAFIQMVGAYPIGSPVFLSTGEMGIVVEANEDPAYPKRPLVKLITDIDGNFLDGPVVNLVETDPETGHYARTIINTLDPEKYGIDVGKYFLALAV
jgi:putative nucleotidyltransferase with HDIG domain